jgi:hypothetical protein
MARLCRVIRPYYRKHSLDRPICMFRSPLLVLGRVSRRFAVDVEADIPKQKSATLVACSRLAIMGARSRGWGKWGTFASCFTDSKQSKQYTPDARIPQPDIFNRSKLLSDSNFLYSGGAVRFLHLSQLLGRHITRIQDQSNHFYLVYLSASLPCQM